MDPNNLENSINSPSEISIKEVLVILKRGIKYLQSQWMYFIIIGVLSLAVALIYSFVKKPIYKAKCTFVLEEGSGGGGGLSQYAGLASLAGIELGGGGGGIFQGDNIIELYKSRLMIEKTLLSSGNFSGNRQLLIDRYINHNKLRIRWKEKDNIDTINFYGDPQKFNRKQDSIITDLVEIFNKKFLTVDKIDKKLSIILVFFESNDELFAKSFTETLVEKVNNFYIDTKTKKTKENIQVLQNQGDSVRRELNSSLLGVASSIQAAPNANSSILSLRVPSQRKQVDVQASTAIYSEIVKNRELLKISLLQETPLIQVIDSPVLPLEADKLGKVKALVYGLIFGILLTIVFLLFKNSFEYFAKL